MTAADPLYFDVMASTPLDVRVRDAMFAALSDSACGANPSASTHSLGQAASALLEAATERSAVALGCSPESVVWTSGATESIHLAVLGAARAYRRQGNHLISMTTEHKATLAVMDQLEKEAADITLLPPLPSGLIDLSVLETSIRADTVLVSIAWVNNETGVIQPIEAIAALCRAKGVLLHVDAAQVLGKLPVDLLALGADLVSLSAHKCYGPKGIGLLYCRQSPPVLLTPLLLGGGQQAYRSGTLPTHQIIGAAEAIVLAQAECQQDAVHAKACREIIQTGLSALPGIRWHVSGEDAVPHCLSCHVEGVDISAVLALCFDCGLATGSACNATTKLPSHVLTAMGLNDHTAHHSLRISYGRLTSLESCHALVTRLSQAITQLREWSPAGTGRQLGFVWPKQNNLLYSAAVWERCQGMTHLGEEEGAGSPTTTYEYSTLDKALRLSVWVSEGLISSCRARVLGSPVLMALAEDLCCMLEGAPFAEIAELGEQFASQAMTALGLLDSDRHLLTCCAALWATD